MLLAPGVDDHVPVTQLTHDADDEAPMVVE
jgi:hypothetical protein